MLFRSQAPVALLAPVSKVRGVETLAAEHGAHRPGDPIECGSSPTLISTTLNGSPVLTNDAWTPTWTAESGDVFSSTFTDLSPVLPVSPVSVLLNPIQARGSLTIFQLPTTSNGGGLILDFNDGPEPGSATYEGLLTITTAGTNTTPEPSSYLLVAMATAGMLLKRSRRRRM